MSYAKYILGGAILGSVLSMSSCVLTKTHHVNIFGAVILGMVVGAVLKFFLDWKNKP